MLELSRFHSRLQHADPIAEFGIIEKIVGNTIESHGPNVTMGCVCWLENNGRRVPVEGVGFTDGKEVLMALGQIYSGRQGDILQAFGRNASIGLSEELRGRRLDWFGGPIR